jgi:hypothetical protein
LDEILLEHENLSNTTFNDNKQESSFLFDQINQWEKDAIMKIQQTAQDTRLQIRQFAEEEKSKRNTRMIKKKPRFYRVII